ncbi:Elongation factor 1-delta, partial [Capsicum annuum]
MAVAFNNVNSDSGLKKLDEYLLTRSYITGYQASKDDITVYSSLAKPPSAAYVNASRWYKHIDALLRISGVSGEGAGVTVEGSAPISEAVATPPAAESKAPAVEDDDDDDVDLFGEETEEEKKAAEERAAALKASGKKKESGKSSVLMDVKPWDDETDMKKLEEAVRGVQMEGLTWGAAKLVPVGYGIKKLQIMLTIVDDLVSVDDLIENYLTVEPINEYVQSCDIDPLKEAPKNDNQSPEVTSKAATINNEAKESPKKLIEKLSAALVNVSAKEDLVKQHAEVAEEAAASIFNHAFLRDNLNNIHSFC